jgi:hypothetical protein
MANNTSTDIFNQGTPWDERWGAILWLKNLMSCEVIKLTGNLMLPPGYEEAINILYASDPAEGNLLAPKSSLENKIPDPFFGGASITGGKGLYVSAYRPQLKKKFARPLGFSEDRPLDHRFGASMVNGLRYYDGYRSVDFRLDQPTISRINRLEDRLGSSPLNTDYLFDILLGRATSPSGEVARVGPRYDHLHKGTDERPVKLLADQALLLLCGHCGTGYTMAWKDYEARFNETACKCGSCGAPYDPKTVENVLGIPLI